MTMIEAPPLAPFVPQPHEEGRMFWLDLETTGLDPNRDSILEVGLVVTSENLDVLDARSWLVKQPLGVHWGSLDPFVIEMHTANGIRHEIDHGEGVPARLVAVEATAFLNAWGKPGKNPMCGSSLRFDRMFLTGVVPFRPIDDWFHYRIIDVSTLKELVRRWKPDEYKATFEQDKTHRTVMDCVASIRELSHYRRLLFQ